MELFLIVAVVAIFEYAAARWGVDTRDSYRFKRN